MSKVKLSCLIQDEIRAIIPYVEEDGKNEYIEIKNPTKEVKEDLSNMIWKGIEDPSISKSQEELLEYMFDKLTNIELNISFTEVLDKNLSYELNMAIFNLTEILTEITNEVLMNTRIQLSKIQTRSLKQEIYDKAEEIEISKNIKPKKVN